VNYGNGIRLLSSNLTVNSRDGHGRWFDQIVLTTIGLGNDPYQSAALRVEKNKRYRYDLLWRLDDYYNPALAISAGSHLMDTSRRLQDHNLTLLPQSKVRFHLGYSRSLQDGPALSTVQLCLLSEQYCQAATSSDFPLYMNVRREQNEYRLGADLELAGFKFSLMHTWAYFKEDSEFSQNGAIPGDNPSAGVTLTQFQRSEPYHGSSPYWLGNLIKSTKNLAVNGHITYVGGRRNFILDENAFGIIPVGAQNQQILVGGNATRPSLTGDLSVSIFPGTRLTVVNNTSVDSTRIDGTSSYQQYNPPTLSRLPVTFRYLGLRTITNATDMHYRAWKWLSFYGGYHYAARRIRDIESFYGDYSQDNHLHAGLVGLRLKPVSPMTISLESEIGRADHPFTPVSDRNYHSLGGRFEYRVRKLTFEAGYRQNYNNNSISITAYSSHARNYNASASWTPRDWFALDADYSKLHLDSLSGIDFFITATTQFTSNQVYISNIHAANLIARFTVKKRVDLFAGYSITRDTGDGRSSAIPAGVASDPYSPALASVQTFPLSYQSPLARVSILLLPKLRWNVGYQFYNYHEDFGLASFYQGYHAHTGYTSVTWSF
jgi:hypothetical protein